MGRNAGLLLLFYEITGLALALSYIHWIILRLSGLHVWISIDCCLFCLTTYVSVDQGKRIHLLFHRAADPLPFSGEVSRLVNISICPRSSRTSHRVQ